MAGQQNRRRIVLITLMLLSAVAMAGLAPDASAKDAQKIPDQGSKANFKANCELLGGTFIEDGLGNTECHYADGSWTECDANGNDCWFTPARLAPPVDGPIPSVPIVDDSDPQTAGGDASADDDHQSGKAKHSKSKKGKKHGHRGKGRYT